MIRRILCGWLGWHRPGPDVTPRGINLHARCARCGREIMRDSQGNWF